MFNQKITDAERVLATVLYQRRVCTRAVLAELFEVSPRTIGTALREVCALPDEDGYTPTPAPARYSTAAAFLPSLAARPTDSTDTPDAEVQDDTGRFRFSRGNGPSSDLPGRPVGDPADSEPGGGTVALSDQPTRAGPTCPPSTTGLDLFYGCHGRR